MVPLFVIHDVSTTPGGDLAIGGTDEYIDQHSVLELAGFEGRRVSILLRGGRQIDSIARGLVVHTALTGKRNVYLRVPMIDGDPLSLGGAIVSVDR
jgi:hypothetical protein